MQNIGRIFLFLILTATFTICWANPTWYRFKQNNLIGFKSANGKIIIPAKYQFAEDPVDGIAAVRDKDEWYYINKQGKKLVTPFIFDNGPDYFVEGLSRFVTNKKMGFINIHGHIVIQPRFDFVTPFNQHYAVYCMGCKSVRYDSDHRIMQGGKWGCIDKSGKIVASSYCEPNFSDWLKSGQIDVGKVK